MSTYAYLGLSLLIIILIYFIFIYNNLVTLKNNVFKAFSNIDVLLKQRHEELPKLVETCKQYMGFEKETLTKITAARTSVMSALKSGDISALGRAEGTLRQGLMSLFAVAENYPDLKANQNFLQLQGSLEGIENDVKNSRKTFNEAVNSYNVKVRSFPMNMLSGMFGFHKKEGFKADEGAEKAPKVEF